MTTQNNRILAISTITVCSLAILFTPNLAFAAQPIPAPTGLTATPINPTQIQLSWTAPVGFGTNTIRGYIIDRESPVGGGFVEIVANTTNTNTAYLDVGLLDDTTYNYRVYTDYNGTAGSKSVASNTAFARTFGFGSGDCTGDCVPPTLGLDSKGIRWVDQGFSYNGNPVDVELFFTPYPLITTKVGVVNTAVFKIFEDGGPDEVRHFDLAFGLARGQILADSKASIEWERAWDGTETVKVIDPEHALQDVRVETSEGSCKTEDVFRNDCLIVVIHHTFRAPLEFNIVGTNVWDEKRNAWQNYYNDGVEIIGKSMNPPDVHQVLDSKGFLHTITETSDNTAIDEQGNKWILAGNFWTKEFIMPKHDSCELSPTHHYDRDLMCFKIYKGAQELLAKLYFDSAQIQNDTPGFTEGKSGEFLTISENKDLQKSIIEEQVKAQKRIGQRSNS